MNNIETTYRVGSLTIRRAIRDRRGISTMMVAVSLPLLLGFAGLAVDTGIWEREHARLQIAADAAAMGAGRLLSNSNATAANFQSAALAEAQLALTGKLVGTLITPVKVTVATDRSSVTVLLQSTADRNFSKILSSTTITLSATSVAGITAASSCVGALSTSAANAIDIENNGSITATGCGVFSNSTSSSSIYVRNGVLSAQSVSSAGGAIASTNGSSTISPTASTNSGSKPDPYASLTAPTPGACSPYPTVYNYGYWTLQPGTYCGGLTIQNGATATFSAGVYNILNGDFTLSGGATITSGNGVGFYLGGTKPGNINWQNYATTTTTITAPTSGWMAGIAIYQDRSAASSSVSNIVGGSTLSISGAIYLPAAQLVINNNAKLTHPLNGALTIMAKTLNIQGSAQITAGGSSNGGGGGRLVLLQ